MNIDTQQQKKDALLRLHTAEDSWDAARDDLIDLEKQLSGIANAVQDMLQGKSKIKLGGKGIFASVYKETYRVYGGQSQDTSYTLPTEDTLKAALKAYADASTERDEAIQIANDLRLHAAVRQR